MIELLRLILHIIASFFKPRTKFVAEILILRQQLNVLRRQVSKRHSLIAQITATVAEASNLSKRNIWVYITDLVSRQMVEFGHMRPEAGDEARWAAALPEADRAYMQSFALPH